MTEPHYEYRLTWEVVTWAEAERLEHRLGKDLRGRLTEAQWDALDWQEQLVVKITTDPWDQHNRLRRWADTRAQAIRNVRLERRECPEPDQGWEPVP